MVTLADIIASLGESAAEWGNLRVAQLLFGHRDAARLTLMVMLAVSMTLLVARLVIGRRPGRDRVALPALLPVMRSSPFSFVRHLALLLFLCGLPFFILALADPFTSLIREDVSFPGRRIGLLIDASSSMLQSFEAPTLAADAPSDARFFTSVAAAESLVRARMKSKFRDVIALIEFGDESYVITPFTNDYENILFSLSLIGGLDEFKSFPDQGTTIGLAIEQAVRLFTTFDFLNTSGNMMVLISDGEDMKTSGPRLGGMNVDAIVGAAAAAKVPIYFLRVARDRGLGNAMTDKIWKPAVEKTGGKFYAVPDEAAIRGALEEIDKVAVGTISISQYTTERPRFGVFALAAAGFWTFALLLQLTMPYLRKFP